MNQLKNIVIGIDFSDSSRAALRQAARIAYWNDAALHVLHVVGSLVVAELIEIMSGESQQIKGEIIKREQQELETFVNDELAKTQQPVETKIEAVSGSPIDEILCKVKAVSADLLVLGSKGTSSAETQVGSLAVMSIRKVPSKVLLVRQDHSTPYNKVVVCVDFSENARLAVEQAVRVATQDNAPLRLVHFYSGPWKRLHYMSPTATANIDFIKKYQDILQHKLEDYTKEFAGQLSSLDVSCDLVEEDDVVNGIQSYLAKEQADLVVIGNRGRSNLRYVLLGSTAQKIFRYSSCSVLSIKPADYQFRP